MSILSPGDWINEVFKYVGTTVVLSSKWVCLISGIIGLILYIFGYEKGKNYPIISIAIYLIINIIGGAIFNV
ncbi:MAG: hypothetical protein IJ094_00020 [Bacilli bacterium]|nr:hypothetical protein [Bacilli bacterium]